MSNLLTKPEVILTGTFPDELVLSEWMRNKVPAVRDAWVLAERVPRAWVKDAEREDSIRFFRSGGDIDVSGFLSGCAFADGFEVRWEPDDVGLRVRYVGEPVEGQDALRVCTDELLRDAEVVDTEYRLWGRRVAGGIKGLTRTARGGVPFVSARIPRVLYYPVTGDIQYVSLVVREYRDGSSGRTCLWRLAGLKEHM